MDVWVDGKLTLDNFTPGTLAGPLNVPDGDHKIAITGADATSADNPVIGPVTVDLEAGRDYTAVAHLAADGTPTATLFTNDISASPDGKGKLTVRHVAAAPPSMSWPVGPQSSRVLPIRIKRLSPSRPALSRPRSQPREPLTR